MNIEEMTSKQISDELSNRGVTMHFNSKREKLEEALMASDNVDVAVAEAPSNKIRITEEELIANDFKVNGVELEGMRNLHALKLQRVIVRSNDPLKRESAGEIFTVGNKIINDGKPVKKYIPFNNEDGWHIPKRHASGWRHGHWLWCTRHRDSKLEQGDSHHCDDHWQWLCVWRRVGDCVGLHGVRGRLLQDGSWRRCVYCL